jgi:hypothetical protein
MKSAIIASNQLFIFPKLVIISEVKEAGAVGKWGGGFVRDPRIIQITPASAN